MIRVLHYGLNANRGGIEIALLRLAEQFVSKPVELAFVESMTAPSAVSADLRGLGYAVFPVRSRATSLLGSRRDWVELLETYKPDILHLHVNTLSYIQPIKLALERGIRVVVHSRSSSSPDKLHTRMLHRRHFNNLKSRDVTRVAVSQTAGEWLHGDQRFTVIFNGIDTRRFSYDPESRSRLRRELGLSDELLIGQIGSFIPVKNHEFSLEVLAHLVDRVPRTKMVFVGSGATKSRIEEESGRLGLSGNTIFLGTRSDVPQLLSCFDAFLLPSLYEGFPNVALEAQTAGLPTYISDAVTQEVRATSLCTYLPLTAGPTRWADAILNNPNGVERELAGSLVFTAGFSAQIEADKFEKMYRQMMDT